MNAARREERVHELRVQRALEGLRERESAELRRLDPAAASLEPDPYELAAAAAQLALMGEAQEPLPAGLRQRIESVARDSISHHPDSQPPGC